MATKFSDNNNQNKVLKSQVENLSAYEKITSALNHAETDPTVKRRIKIDIRAMKYEELTKWYHLCLRSNKPCSAKDVPIEIDERMEELAKMITYDIQCEAAQSYLGVDPTEWDRLYTEYLDEMSAQSYL